MATSEWVQAVYESFESDGSRRRSSSPKTEDSDREEFDTADEREPSDGSPDEEVEPTPRSKQKKASIEENDGSSSKPTCRIRLAGGRYKKDIELTMDSKIDDVIYKILKCMDEECIDIEGLHVKGRKSPMGFLQHCLAPFASCFSYKPPGGQPNRRRRTCCPCSRSRPRKSSCSPEQERRRKSTNEVASDESCAEGEKPRRAKSRKRKKKRRRKRKGSACSRLLKSCGKTLLCSRSCCHKKDDVVLIEICPSRTTDTDVKYKKQKERGVGTDTSPELEILLRGDSLRCVAKKTGMRCKCRNCCPKSKKKCDPNKRRQEPIAEEKSEVKEPEKELDEPRKSNDSRKSQESDRKKRSTLSDDRGKLSFERTYSLLLNSNYDPMWDSDYESTSRFFSNDFDVSTVSTTNQKPFRWRMNRGRTPLLYSARSEPLNVYSALQQKFLNVVDVENLKHCRKKLINPERLDEIHQHIAGNNSPIPVTTTSRKRKISSRVFFGRDYILELHETSESVEETLRDQHTKRQTVRISDQLRLHKLFQRSHMSRMSSLTSSNSRTTSSTSDDKAKKTNRQQEDETSRVTLLKNEYSSLEFVSKMCSHHNMSSKEHLSATSPPQGGLQLKTSRLLFTNFPPTKKSTNLLAFLKNLRADRRLSKTKGQVTSNDQVKPKKNFTRKCVKSFEKLKIYLRRARKSKSKTFLPVTLNKKQGVLDLSSLISQSS